MNFMNNGKMERGNGKLNTALSLMIEENHGKNPNQFGEHQDLNSKLSEYESSVMNFDRRYTTLSQTALHHRPELE